jgi:hypothetical protein
MSSDQDKKNKSSEDSIENIKREETEDPTEYYAQGDSKENFDEESEFSKPVPPIGKRAEEMSLLKAVAYLGFGLAALAIVFILFFIRDLDDRVGGMDLILLSLEEKMAPLRREVKESLEQVNADITGLKTRVEDRENRTAVIELKRALVAIQDMGLSDSPKAKAKSNEVVASIQALLGEFGAGEPVVGTVPAQVPAGEVKVQEAQDLIELPAVEQVTEENKAPVVIEEHLKEATNEVVAEQESLPQPTEETEEPVLESAEPKSDEEDEDDEDDDEDE